MAFTFLFRLILGETVLYLGIFLAVELFIFMAPRGVNVFLTSIICTLVVSLTNSKGHKAIKTSNSQSNMLLSIFEKLAKSLYGQY